MKKSKPLDDKRIILPIALVLAVFAWIIIAGFVNPGSRIPLENIFIDYERGSQAYTDQNLQIVGNPESSYADVQVQGDGSVLGNLNQDSVAVYVDYSAVKGPGKYELPLRVERLSSGFTVVGVTVTSGNHTLDRNPKNTATITFEEITRTTFPVSHRTENVKPASGNLVKGTVFTDPTEVTITGPKTKVDQIAQVVAIVTNEEEITETTPYTGVSLTLFDASGKEMDQSEMSLVFSNPTVTVTVPILEQREISLDVGLTGVPQGLDEEWLRSKLVLSHDKLKVTGPPAGFEHLEDPYIIHVIDISTLEPNWESDPINLKMPEGSNLTIEGELRQVTVTLDSSDMKEVTIEVPATNIRVINQPTNATVSPVADSISVRLFGEAGQIDAVMAENITVQLDATTVTTGGGSQQTVRARILIPKYNRVFAISGEDGYTMVCDVEVN